MTPKERARGYRLGVKTVLRDGSISFEARCLWLLMESYADMNGLNCFPSVAKLATVSGHSIKWVEARLRDLKKKGWITILKKKTEHGRVNLYQLHYPGGGHPQSGGNGSPPNRGYYRVSIDRNQPAAFTTNGYDVLGSSNSLKIDIR